MSETDVTEQIAPSTIYPDGKRVLKAATQEDLKYVFEKLGMKDDVEIVEEEKQIDSKNDINDDIGQKSYKRI